MPYAKHISQYPEQFFRLLEKATASQKGIRLHEESPKKALALRSRLFAFFGALRKEAQRIQEEQLRIVQNAPSNRDTRKNPKEHERILLARQANIDHKDAVYYSRIADGLLVRVESSDVVIIQRKFDRIALLIDRDLGVQAAQAEAQETISGEPSRLSPEHEEAFQRLLKVQAESQGVDQYGRPVESPKQENLDSENEKLD